MTEITNVADTAGPDDPEGVWKTYYTVVRDDGREVMVDAQGSPRGLKAAEKAEEATALAFLADHGRAAALEYAELANPDTDTLIHLWVNENGSLCHSS